MPGPKWGPPHRGGERRHYGAKDPGVHHDRLGGDEPRRPGWNGPRSGHVGPVDLVRADGCVHYRAAPRRHGRGRPVHEFQPEYWPVALLRFRDACDGQYAAGKALCLASGAISRDPGRARLCRHHRKPDPSDASLLASPSRTLAPPLDLAWRGWRAARLSGGRYRRLARSQPGPQANRGPARRPFRSDQAVSDTDHQDGRRRKSEETGSA